MFTCTRCQRELDDALLRPRPGGADLCAGCQDAASSETPPSSPTAADPVSRETEAPSCTPTLIRSQLAVGPRPNIPRRLGPYILAEELGHGGMGVVYHALHTRLGTPCAVKVLIAGEHASADAIARFRREAAAVARMGKHPNIVTVHDLGEEGSIAYYAMDLVRGRSLQQRLRERAFPPKDAAALMEKVARALHFAHGHGVVHRDVKPANIVVSDDGNPQVMDFGLARDLESTAQVSATGQVMGTPAYMAPEQVRGERGRCDSRTDVYALGATLYEMLVGIPPHDGEDFLSVFQRILAGEVVLPRRLRSGVPRDLETVCMKCLEVDPGRRYTSAGDLADDLGRFVAGQPVLARPVGPLGRLVRRVRRNPVVSGLAAVSIVATLAVGGVWWRGHEREAAAARAEREAVDRYLRELAHSGEAIVEAALARRALGDLKGSRKIAARLDDPVEELIGRAPDRAEPWYYKGRMLRALGRELEAMAAQDRAVELARAPGASQGSRDVLPLALYQRGVMRAEQYDCARQEKLQEVLASRARGDSLAPAPPLPTTPEVEARYPELVEMRLAATDDLRRVVEGATGDDEPRSEVARGLVQVLARRSPEEVSRRLLHAVELDPWLEEAYAALALVAISRDAWEEAASWYEKGHQADRGHVPHLLGLARALYRSMREAEDRGRDPEPSLRRALAALKEASRLDPERFDTWLAIAITRNGEGAALAARGADPSDAFGLALDAAREALSLVPDDAKAIFQCALTLLRQGDWLHEQGKDPDEAYRGALEGFERALSLDPRLEEAASNAAAVCLSQSRWLCEQGKDPSETYAKALAHCDRAQALNPRSAEVGESRGLVYWSQGDWLRGQGKDPGEAYASALAAFESAIVICPESAEVLHDMATVHWVIGDWLRGNGGNPSDAYAKALAVFDRALSINPQYALAANNQGAVYQAMGEYLRAQGKDPREAYEKARAGFEKALSINPRLAEAANELGTLFWSQADWMNREGKDPREALAQARAAFDRALSINPRLFVAINNRANIGSVLGDWLRTHGQDPSETYAEAADGYERALSLNPRYGPAASNLAGVSMSLGDWQRSRGQDPNQAYARALAACDKALSINPRDEVAACNLGSIWRAKALWQFGQGEDPEDSFARAKAGFENALSINTQYFPAVLHLAGVRTARGDILRGKGKDPSEEYAKALDGYDRAHALNPSAWEPCFYRGAVLEVLGRFDEAIGSYEEALRIRPNEPCVKEALERVRQGH